MTLSLPLQLFELQPLLLTHKIPLKTSRSELSALRLSFEDGFVWPSFGTLRSHNSDKPGEGFGAHCWTCQARLLVLSRSEVHLTGQ